MLDHSIIQHISLADLIHHCPIWKFIAFLLHHCLVQMRVKKLAFRSDFFQSFFYQDIFEILVNQLHSLVKTVKIA